MALVERYLNAVKFWLPRNQKDDIIAELADDLRAQIEEKESELGHKLTDAEVEPILKSCGSPMLVAERYLPQQYLIGPALFPVYRVVIRSLFLYFLLPWLALWLALILFSPAFRAAHAGGQIFATLDPWWLACTYALFFNTLAFALLDRSHLRSRVVNDWNPRALPVVRDRNKLSRACTIFELTFAVATLALWFEIGAFRRVFHLGAVTISLSHAWPVFFWTLSAASAGGILVSCLNLTNPRWTRLTACLRLGVDVSSFLLFAWICSANLLQSIEAAKLPSTDAANLVHSINSWVSKGTVWVLVVGAVVLFFDVVRIVRVEKDEKLATDERFMPAQAR